MQMRNHDFIPGQKSPASSPPPSESSPARPNAPRRFITYLPHSGFNNQRIALENAMLLSYILNCTLVAPPVRLGRPLPYRPFDVLENQLMRAGEPKPLECLQTIAGIPALPQCAEYESFVVMSWSELVDFEVVRNDLGLDILFINGTHTPARFLQQTMGVPNEDITFLKDQELYQYRIQDADLNLEESRYRTAWSVDSLRELLDSSRAIHFGTLFGSGRLKVRGSDRTAARAKVRAGMVISNRAVLDTASAIRAKFAEKGYLAVHVRVGDRKFKASARMNGRLIWWELVRMLGVPEKVGVELEHAFLRLRKKNAKKPVPPGVKDDVEPWFNQTSRVAWSSCRSSKLHIGAYASYLNAPLFIASDAPNPRTHSALAIFFATFPCAYVLSDFPEEVQSLVSRKDPPGRFLIPLVDAVIAGQATRVLGTYNSTFSDFVTGILHPAYSRSE
ncbi:hypothetical protein BDV93DRAFT_491405 [Ceratobasidium sp. AG-I]|nr:hypothetical protein BDV93DRAFT_491405 [Ceratobasidium sp. AG-I]